MAENFSTRTGEWSDSSSAPREVFGYSEMSGATDEKGCGLTNQAGELFDDAKAKVQEWTSEIADVALSMKQSAQDAASVVIEKGHNLEQELASFIRRYPVPCMMAGFGLGLVLAHASRRR
jgi:hypothetical protein